jgi:hypothetical protein
MSFPSRVRSPTPAKTEQPDLRALCERADQVDDLDAGLEDLHLRLLLRHGWRGPVDRPARHAFGGGFVVDRSADHVEHPAQRLDADRDRDRSTGSRHRVTATKAICGVHGDAPHDVVPDCAFDLQHHYAAVLLLDLEGLEQLRLVAGRERHIDDGSDDLAHVTDARLLFNLSLGLGHSSLLS